MPKGLPSLPPFTWDRAFRVALGLFVLSLTVWGPRTPWGLVGLVPLTGGLVGGCPLPAPARSRPGGPVEGERRDP